VSRFRKRSAAEAWHAERTLHHGLFPAGRLAAEREASISICLPARDEAATIGPILERLLPLAETGAIDQVVVVDDSTDGTAEIARALGAEVHEQSSLQPAYGPVRGKGDAMWRALTVLTGEVVVFLDADSEEFGAHFACGLAGPVALPGPIEVAKAFYRRPFRVGDVTLPSGGGRVTELTARPLLNLFFPELAGFLQPLAGEIAVRRDLLERLPFCCGYAVDIALLIDCWREVGLRGMAQVDLEVRQNRHQPLHDLGPMAYAVAAAVTARAHADGRIAEPPPDGFLAPAAAGMQPRDLGLVERPPMALAVPADPVA
jgi:glucosyl-3-phosphoglycerate synthase